MLPDHEIHLRHCAEVIVRVGLNLQPGQRLLIAEPYELQGVSREANGLVEAVSAAVIAAGCPPPEVIWGDAARLREFTAQADERGFARLVAAQARQMKRHLADSGAFLFPLSSFPHLMDGIPAEHVSRQRQMGWEHFGPIVQQLTRGASQWTLVPAPTPTWADAAFADLPATDRLDALWQTVFEALRIPAAQDDPSASISPVDVWQNHFASLQQHRSELNKRRPKSIHYQGPGTDLRVKLPDQHEWCTAQLVTKSGIAYVANLPTEEVFTAPDCKSAEGTVRVARPVNYGGTAIEGIELEFKHGRVVHARARTGGDLLQRLLDTDDGSCRLGEVAMVVQADSDLAPPKPSLAGWQKSGRLFYHTLLDENAANHIALGESYRFCNRSLFAFGLNRSLVHVDLPLDARATLV